MGCGLQEHPLTGIDNSETLPTTRVGIEKLKACLQVVKSSLPPMLPSHPFPNWNELGSARIWLIFVLVDRESFKLHALTVSYQNLLSLICIIIV